MKGTDSKSMSTFSPPPMGLSRRRLKVFQLLLAVAVIGALVPLCSVLLSSEATSPGDPTEAVASAFRERLLLSSLSEWNRTNCTHFVDRASNHLTTYLLDETSSVPLTHPSPQAEAIPKSIFFLHFNERLKNPKYLCSLESAARKNPNHTITVHAANHKTFIKSIRKWSSALPEDVKSRIVVSPLNWEETFQDTPLESWFQQGLYKESTWVEQNLGNGFRLAQLYKSGGVYMDLDILSINPVGGMARTLAKQDWGMFNNAFFSMNKTDAFVWQLMEEFAESFNGYKWGFNGPEMVMRAYNSNCHPPGANMSLYHSSCDDLNVALSTSFSLFNTKIEASFMILLKLNATGHKTGG
ncbi:hypothetical protein BCR33DRAFT_763232 [Rhizoclosmatium globosum]|uniref:Alpha 1,4-glycosyltransferase domain-containing protein n=1 Tax=Rhizoclosmatium globosum TaxID=329046 RepID=A0A1Y2CR75_9FUNG|nr:hypothetical protein BCR33DRAFT_763232 [Rhizoclosmatium globosum]|eukprot:ORY49457.1 hypothetical protein BCR33DRAFT_763232 [Rhizoclosmatium globosum]